MTKIVILLLLLTSGCGRVMFFVGTGKMEPPPRVQKQKETDAGKALRIAVLKALMDKTWGMAEIQKEVKYQLYLQRQKANDLESSTNRGD